MRFVAWNIWGLYGTGSLTAGVRELARYKLDLVVVQRVSQDKGGHGKSRGFSFLSMERKLINW